MVRKQKFVKKIRAVKQDCNFCKTDTDPDYKDTEGLTKFVTDRGKILGKSRTGICSKHQRSMFTAIKRARHIGLIPFVVRS